MITVLLVNMNAEVKIFHYDVPDPAAACRRLLDDWRAGVIEWEFWRTNEAFTPEWMGEYGLDPETGPTEEQGVTVYTWFCSTGPDESDIEIVTGYFIRSVIGERCPPIHG